MFQCKRRLTSLKIPALRKDARFPRSRSRPNSQRRKPHSLRSGLTLVLWLFLIIYIVILLETGMPFLVLLSEDVQVIAPACNLFLDRVQTPLHPLLAPNSYQRHGLYRRLHDIRHYNLCKNHNGKRDSNTKPYSASATRSTIHHLCFITVSYCVFLRLGRVVSTISCTLSMEA